MSPSSAENAVSDLLSKIPFVTGSNNGRRGSLRSYHVATSWRRPGATSIISLEASEPGIDPKRVWNRKEFCFQVRPWSRERNTLIVEPSACFAAPSVNEQSSVPDAQRQSDVKNPTLSDAGRTDASQIVPRSSSRREGVFPAEMAADEAMPYFDLVTNVWSAPATEPSALVATNL